ncbi:MAG: prepilin-type N-terminal cleavage/methylation domain-containing protein [Clostridia bacterium]|nr:prepilin-type N-terminal cleavage/methylation domain-containing protein [Clostridia bacterium]
MKSKLRQKIPKCRTKKGLSLVELIVGVTIIAMVLASASGVIVTGYKTTIDNATRNKAAALSASMNDVVLKAIKNCGFSEQSKADEQFKEEKEPVYAAVNNMYQNYLKSVGVDPATSPRSVYCSSTGNFSAEDGDWQYYLNTGAKRHLADGTALGIDILGVEITTAVAAAGGFEEIVSFVPYNDQSIGT